MAQLRPILHIDLDAFFASIEERDRPELRGKPVIIGGRPDQRGVVSTCSYAARKYGVRSAMPLTEAYRRCPHGIFLPGNMAKYKAASRQVFAIFHRFTPLVEPISIDEAFLDLTGCTNLFGDPLTIARKIKELIKQEVGITASAGLAHNKFLAKIASDLQKPDGLVWIKPEEIEQVLHPLPISRLWGVGPKTAEKLRTLGIDTIGDLAAFDIRLLARVVGTGQAHHLKQLAAGQDDRPVMSETEIKSMGHEHTFPTDVCDLNQVIAILLHLAEKVGRRLRRAGLYGRTVALKLRYHDFTTLTRHVSLPEPTNLDQVIYQTGKELLLKNYNGQPVRLIGISLQNLSPTATQQLSFLEGQAEKEKRQKLAQAMDKIKNRFGEESITYAKVKESEPEWELN
ncbi:MAG: DNA polymerase IV [Firmicutes bacterium]|nr:DNA polymerase IV [Bacillota bacterium]